MALLDLCVILRIMWKAVLSFRDSILPTQPTSQK